MSPALCISFRFIQPFPLFHGRADGDEPEWPPSPMRAFQALLNAACLRTRGNPLPADVRAAFRTIEVLRPSIIAPRATPSTTGHRAYVPHNHADLVTAAWARGNVDASISSHRVEKDFRPHRIETGSDELPAIHYLYPLDAVQVDPADLLRAIRPSVRSIHCLGWGVDQVVADAMLIESRAMQSQGERWTPSSHGGKRLRVHRTGSLDALTVRYDRFLKRLTYGDWTPVPPLIEFDQVRYRRHDESAPRSFAVFELRNLDGSRFRYPHRRLIHIAGMVRHLAIEAMKKDPPRGVDNDWVESYVAGHASSNLGEHRQFSYVPLPSIGHEHTEPGVRRVMIVAPAGDDTWLDHLARRLAGQMLKPDPEHGNEFPDGEAPLLVPVKHDNMARFYTQPASVWHSFTPVILPGHDDHNPEKTRALIERALKQSGIEQPCEFEWSAFSRFRKSYSAHKYDRDRRPQGYIRPKYLLSQTAVHLTLRFHDGSADRSPVEVPGPMTIGSGRHCGFGLMAAAD